MNADARHLISINDLTDDDVRDVTERAVLLGERAKAGWRPKQTLDGQVVGVYFRHTSTRTRIAFSSAALRLGAQVIPFGAGDLQTNTGETTEDTGRVLSRMLDVLVARTADDEAEMCRWAAQSRMSVVNAMSEQEHPTQAFADLATLSRQFGRVDGLRVLYVGEGNNSAASLALALSRFRGVELHLRTPLGYGLSAVTLEQAAKQAGERGGSVVERHDMADLPAEVDAIYTTRWRTTGTTKSDPNWQDVFAPFRVGAELWQSSPNAVFMHDLPAHRGEEVTAEVLDGPHSIAFDQAENKMHSAMAVLEWCRGG